MTRPAPEAAATLAFLLLSTGLPGTAAAAEEHRMTGAEITEALTGNSVHGLWGSREYRSFFDASGATIYAEKGRPADTGRWSVKGDQYCSVWAMSGESCYRLYRDGERIIWEVPGSGARYDSRLIPGKALEF